MKKKKTDQTLEKAAAYVLGALEEKEHQEFKGRMKTLDPELRNEVEEFRAVTAYLPSILEQHEPAQRVRERIMGVVREQSKGVKPISRPAPAPTIPRSRAFWGLRIGVAFAVVVFVVGFGVYVNSLLQTIEEQNVQITELKNEVERQQEILALLESPQVNIVIMNGLDPSPQGHGKIMWDPVLKRAVLYITNLPATPRDKDYQLWQIVDSKPVSAGVFSVSAEGEGFFKVEPIEVPELKRVNAFAVTLEPKGGVPQPTGEMYLLGSPRF